MRVVTGWASPTHGSPLLAPSLCRPLLALPLLSTRRPCTARAQGLESSSSSTIVTVPLFQLGEKLFTRPFEVCDNRRHHLLVITKTVTELPARSIRSFPSPASLLAEADELGSADAHEPNQPQPTHSPTTSAPGDGVGE